MESVTAWNNETDRRRVCDFLHTGAKRYKGWRGMTQTVIAMVSVLMLEGNKRIERLAEQGDYQEAALRFMQMTKSMCRPVWKPMHKQPVYAKGASPKSSPEGKDFVCYEGPNMVAYVNGVSEAIFKVGFCLPAGPYVSDEDVHYIVACIKEAIQG